MARLISIPDWGVYGVAIDPEGVAMPRLFTASERITEEAREAFEVVPVLPMRPEEVAECIQEKSARLFPPPCPIELRGEGRPALVYGEELPTVTGAGYRVLEYLVSIYPDGAKRGELNRAADTKDASSVLGALARRDKRWYGALRFPRGVGEVRGVAGKYGINVQGKPVYLSETANLDGATAVQLGDA